eukprot:3635404-Rhodomonas_salina.1
MGSIALSCYASAMRCPGLTWTMPPQKDDDRSASVAMPGGDMRCDATSGKAKRGRARGLWVKADPIARGLRGRKWGGMSGT